MNARSNRRNATAAATQAAAEPTTPDTDVTADPTPTPEVTPDAAQQPEPQDAPDADVQPQPEQDAPAPDITESDVEITESDTAPDATAPAPMTPRDYLAIATAPVTYDPKADMTSVIEAKTSALAAAATLMMRALLPILRDKQQIDIEVMLTRVNGASGRSVQPGNATAYLAQALFGSAVTDCVTHDRNSTYQGSIWAFLPADFKAAWDVLNEALHAPAGPIVTAEHAELVRVNAHIQACKGRTLTDLDGSAFQPGTAKPVTTYSLQNKRTRAAMQAVANAIAAQVSAAFPADDPDVAVIRRIQTASAAVYAATPLPGKRLFQVSGKYAPAPAPEPETVNA